MSQSPYQLDIALEGMTCAACARRIERALNDVDGVDATVNFALERAHVSWGESADIDTSDVIDAVRGAGYNAAVIGDDSIADSHASSDALRLRVIVTGLLALPVMLMSMVQALQFSGWQWVSLVLATFVVWWGGAPIHRAAWRGVRHASLGMDVLVSMGAVVSWAWSIWVLTTTSAGDLDHTMSMSMTHAAAGRASEIYLEVGATLVFVILLGRWLEARARYRASDALRQLAAITPRIALRINTDGGEEEVLIDRISPGDCVRVRVGDRIPVDGVVREGTANIDRSLVTGEATPAAVAPGDEVAGGTVNLDGVLAVEALRVGAASTIGQIALLVQRAQTTKAPIERRADQVAGIFVPVVILLAALTAVTWTALGASSTVIITNTVAVLIVACPCALGLATPAALMVASGRGAKLGLIISGAHVLESSQQIDTVVFDKTGTITTGQFAVSAIDVLDGDIEADEVLRRAASVEQGSAHPLAHALVAEAQRRSIPLASISLARPIVGGMAARVDRVDVQVGHERVLERYPALDAPALDGILARHRAQGRSVMIVAWDERVRGVIACTDQVRAQSAAAIDRLRAAGVQPILLTGDHEQAARSVGAAAGFEEIRADALPEHKIEFLEQLARDGRHVAMVGDGINDAPALAAAQLGIAMGAGSDAAQAASDMTIVSNDLSMVPTALQLARRTFAIIRGNLFWAFFYNVAALPLAATGRLTPIVAAIAMSASSLFVVGNSMRLRRVSLDGPSRPSN